MEVVVGTRGVGHLSGIVTEGDDTGELVRQPSVVGVPEAPAVYCRSVKRPCPLHQKPPVAAPPPACSCTDLLLGRPNPPYSLVELWLVVG
jgi:hypothetical protein